MSATELCKNAEKEIAPRRGVKAPPIMRVTEGRETAPLSFAQQRLWLIDQLQPGSAVYNCPAALRLKGPLDVGALDRAFNGVVNRHQALRTTFPVVAGEPVQKIAAPASEFVAMPVIDLSGLGESERESEVQGLATEEARRPFNLEAGPLVRVKLLRLGEEESVLLLTMHHIVCDGWSMGVLVEELAALYGAHLRGEESSLPEAPVQYADYAVWQREWMRGEALEAQLSYWREKLSNLPPPPELPFDRRRPAQRTDRGAVCPFSIGEELSRRFRALCRSEGVTLYMGLLAAFQALLYRYTGQEDVCVGTPVANRNRRELEGVIGFLINTAVIRTEVRGEEGFRELLRRVREATLKAYAHQDAPFERVVEEVEPERAMSHSPLFQVMFTLQNAPLGPLRLHGLELSLMTVETQTAKFDLTLEMEDTKYGLRGSIEYSTDLFDAATIERMHGHIKTLLEAFVEDMNAPMAELPLLTETERRLSFVKSQGRAQAFPSSTCLHRLFEAQVERSPDVVAVVYEDQQLSYGELNRRSNQLTRRLHALGVGPDVLVALCLDRSVEMVVAILAVLKAGGAYLPLDPAYPQQRLAFMLEDSGARIVLSQSRLLDRLPPRDDVTALCLDGDWPQVAAEGAADLPERAAAANLAYVIYTSGSTGKPKGVMIEHRQATRLFAATESLFGFNEGDVWTMFHSYAFDFSVWEIWGALLYGGKLIVVPYLVSRSYEAFYDLLREHEVTALNQTPSAFRQLIRVEESAGVKDLSLRLVIFGGEALDLQSLKPWLSRHGDQTPRLVNMYGITETTVHVTYRPITLADVENASGSMIGAALPDLRLYILDGHQQPAPVGVPGEIYVGGAGVARGYLHRPDLTAERFTADQFGAEPGERLYRTGDMARHLLSGDIEYRGRADQQVKIRGFRIETGEIEAALAQYPGARESVVAPREDQSGEKCLVAYVVPEEGWRPSTAELRKHLLQRLPEYMVPAAFVTLGSLPLTANGKIDRRSLPALAGANRTLENNYIELRNEIDRAIAGVWEDILQIERVGLSDNFFDLGGHSLLVVQVVSRLREIFGVDVPAREVFESPTLAELADSVALMLRAGHGGQAPPIMRVTEGRETAPLSFAQQRLWLIDQLQPGSAVYNCPAALRLKGPLDVGALERAFNGVVNRHHALRTTFPVVGGEPVQRIAAPASEFVAMPVIDLSGLGESERESEVQRLASDEARRPFDLEAGPLVRVKLLRLEEEESVLLLTMHHIVCDGWSMGVLVEELAALYRAYLRGENSPLPELPVQYADYAVWQREWMSGEALEAQLSFWRGRLLNLPPRLRFPSARSHSDGNAFHSATHFFEAPESVSKNVKTLSRLQNATLFMTLLAAFKTLLYRYTGEEGFVVGCPTANRDRIELEPLIGFFVNTLALGARLSGAQTFKELLRAVRATVLEAIARQDLPFEKLVEDLRPERDSNRTPLFNVWFDLEVAKPWQTKFPDLTISEVYVDKGVDPFDLSLSMTDEGGVISGCFTYNSGLFGDKVIGRMATHLISILEQVATNPDCRLLDIPLGGGDHQPDGADGAVASSPKNPYETDEFTY